MASLARRNYIHEDFSQLLAELNMSAARQEAAEPRAETEKPKPEAESAPISPEARQRASLLDNPRMKFAYSQADDLIHDRDCEELKAVPDADFRMLADFDRQRRVCPKCGRKAIVRSGIGDDAKFINAYVRLFDRLNATTADLKWLIFGHGAKLSEIDRDRVVIKVHEDRWMIRYVDGRPCLYHNNYTVLEDYRRLFRAEFHEQHVAGRSFHCFVRTMLEYSWAEHVVIRKQRALEKLQAQLRTRLAAVSNWLRVPRFSLFHNYYTVLSCKSRFGTDIRTSGMKYVVVDKIREPDSPYRLVTLRVRKWQKKKFCAVVEGMKEYSIAAGYHDYADQCEKRLRSF